VNLLDYDHNTVATKRLIYDRDAVPTKRVIYDRDTVPTKRVIYGHNCNVYCRLHQHKRRYRVVYDRCKHQPGNLAALHVEK